MRVDALVAAGCALAYVGAAIWATQSGALATPFDVIVGAKDALIAGICSAWAMAERGGVVRARGIAFVASLVILVDALLVLVGGVGPWRTEISPDGSLTTSLVIGVGLVVAGVALVWFVRRPDTLAR